MLTVLCLRLQRYFDRLADDLEAYSTHAKRKTIEVEDVELLMRRYIRCRNLRDVLLSSCFSKFTRGSCDLSLFLGRAL